MIDRPNIEQENPFGALDVEKLLKFENSIGRPIPTEYRDYLCKYNGGDFLNSYYRNRDNPRLCASVHNMFGLHDGPKTRRLQDNHDLSSFYELERFRETLADYLCIGRSGTGYLIAVSLSTGSVYTFTPDIICEETEAEVIEALTKIAGNFKEFEEGLVDQQSFFETDPDDDDYDEWEKEMVRQGKLSP